MHGSFTGEQGLWDTQILVDFCFLYKLRHVKHQITSFTPVSRSRARAAPPLASAIWRFDALQPLAGGKLHDSPLKM